MKRAEWSKSSMNLIDIGNGTELAADTYADSMEDCFFDGALPVYVLNFWHPAGMDRTHGPDSFKQIAVLRPLGFILVLLDPGNDGQGQSASEDQPKLRRYRRVGMYHGEESRSWFQNSRREAVMLE
jgi:hypothetical protein